MTNEDFAACFTRIGPYPRDESMLVLLKMLDIERENYAFDSVMMHEFGARKLASIRINGKDRESHWRVY